MPSNETARSRNWVAATGSHVAEEGQVLAHASSLARIDAAQEVTREVREAREKALLAPGATLSNGAGRRARPEEPDAHRTCFQRDRDRIVHSTAFRRLAGKTQVIVYPRDHERTRLTHALEVAQVATSIARGVGANTALVDAIAVGHDCGHGPGGHASEDAFNLFIPEGYEHGVWGADVILAGLNLCAETLDGIRNHSWSRPAPQTVEGEIVSWADRIAYCAHDLEDAVHAGIVSPADLPDIVVGVCGRHRSEQLGTFIRAVIRTTVETGQVGMDADTAAALAALRDFNYRKIYTRPESAAQSDAVIRVLRALVEFYAGNPAELPASLVAAARHHDPVRAAVTYVGGMTDRYAFSMALSKLGWERSRLPRGIGRDF